MGYGGAIAAGVVGVAGVGALLLYQKSKQAPAAGSSLCASTLQPLASTFGFLIPGQACGVIDSVADKVADSFKSWEQKDADNRKLNGEVETALAPDLRAACVSVKTIVTTTAGGGAGGVQMKWTGHVTPMLQGTVLRFKNGGVPFEGHPDFAKCAPGTFSMLEPNTVKSLRLAKPGVGFTYGQVSNAAGQIVESKLAPLIAGEVKISRLFLGHESDPSTSIQLSYVAGKKHACPSGQVLLGVQPTTDHRTGKQTAVAVCGKPGESPSSKAPPSASDSPFSSTSHTAPPGSAPAGYKWVAMPAPGHWERT